MTMQLGMVGTDGIVLASDRLWVDNRVAIRNPLYATKFRVNRECGVAVACSGSMRTSERLADEIVALTAYDRNWMSGNLGALRELSDKTFRSVEAGREDAQCLAVFTQPDLQMCVFRTAKVDGEWSVTAKMADSIAYSGDTANAAIFWGMSYYCPLPVERMCFLAAHMILSAARLNTAGVGGLEIALCTQRKIEKLSKEKIEQLAAKSKVLDEYLTLAILGDPSVSSFQSPDILA